MVGSTQEKYIHANMGLRNASFPSYSPIYFMKFAMWHHTFIASPTHFEPWMQERKRDAWYQGHGIVK
jgi:hypothetical protein